MLSVPHITSISATMVLLVLGNDRVGWEKRLTVHRIGYPICLITEPFLLKSSLDGHLHGNEYLHVLHPSGQIHKLFPKCLSHHFSNHAQKFPSP